MLSIVNVTAFALSCLRVHFCFLKEHGKRDEKNLFVIDVILKIKRPQNHRRLTTDLLKKKI
jgi:hypothetical protein